MRATLPQRFCPACTCPIKRTENWPNLSRCKPSIIRFLHKYVKFLYNSMFIHLIVVFYFLPLLLGQAMTEKSWRAMPWRLPGVLWLSPLHSQWTWASPRPWQSETSCSLAISEHIQCPQKIQGKKHDKTRAIMCHAIHISQKSLTCQRPASQHSEPAAGPSLLAPVPSLGPACFLLPFTRSRNRCKCRTNG